MSVKWAKSIPSFQQLASSDQGVLLQHCWSHLVILSLSQWQVGLSNTEDSELRQAVTRISQLGLDHTEFTCLKALVLFNPDISGLSHSLQVEVLQDQTHLMLQEYCSAKHHQQHAGSKVRFGRLLLTLAAVFRIDKEELETMFFRGTLGNIRVDRLIMDLMQVFILTITTTLALSTLNIFHSGMKQEVKKSTRSQSYIYLLPSYLISV